VVGLTWRAARSLVAREGLTGLYRGTPATLLRTFVGQAVALSVYARLMAHAPGGTT
jgi:hypothetical protein